MWVHCCSPSTESAVGYESGMMSSGYIQQRDELKGGRGVILTNHNKGRATGPSRLGEWRKEKKSYCVENQVVVTALVDSKSVTDPHSLPFIYLWAT